LSGYCFDGILPTASFGQAILKGRVVAERTGQPIPTVNVYLAGTTFGQSTDTNGNFKISLQSEL